MPAAPCRVCGDRGSGSHYGVVTCVACKSFFKRTVQLCLTYRCEASGACQIDRAGRAQCPACRLRRCLRSGMRTDLVRSLATDEAAIAQSPEASSEDSSRHGALDGGGSCKPTAADEPDRLLAQLSDIEPHDFTIDVSFAVDHLQRLLLPESVRNATRLLTAADAHAARAAGWVNRLPGLNQLAPGDRERLFEENWPSPVVATVAWNSLGSDAADGGERRFDGVHVCRNLRLSDSAASAPDALRPALVEAQRLAWRLRHLRVTRSEYLTLKPLLLLCSQNPELQLRTESLMDPYLRLLARVCPDRARRASLLLLAGDVARVRARAAAFWRRAADRDGHALPPLLVAALRGLVRIHRWVAGASR